MAPWSWSGRLRPLPPRCLPFAPPAQQRRASGGALSEGNSHARARLLVLVASLGGRGARASSMGRRLPRGGCHDVHVRLRSECAGPRGSRRGRGAARGERNLHKSDHQSRSPGRRAGCHRPQGRCSVTPSSHPATLWRGGRRTRRPRDYSSPIWAATGRACSTGPAMMARHAERSHTREGGGEPRRASK